MSRSKRRLGNPRRIQSSDSEHDKKSMNTQEITPNKKKEASPVKQAQPKAPAPAPKFQSEVSKEEKDLKAKVQKLDAQVTELSQQLQTCQSSNKPKSKFKGKTQSANKQLQDLTVKIDRIKEQRKKYQKRLNEFKKERKERMGDASKKYMDCGFYNPEAEGNKKWKK